MVVHLFFKKGEEYKIKMFFNKNAMFKDANAELKKIIDEYEMKYSCSLGDTTELKLINLPETFLNEKEILFRESVVTDEKTINDLKKCEITEIQ